MPPKKKASGKKSKKTGKAKAAPLSPLRLKVLLAALSLCGLLLLCLILLARWRPPPPPSETARPVPAAEAPARPPAVAPRPPAPAPRPPARHEDLRLVLESSLRDSGIPRDAVRMAKKGEAWQYDIAAAFPAGETVAGLGRRLEYLDPGLAVEARPERAELRLRRDGALIFLLRFRPPQELAAPVPGALPAARVAIIMDDLGGDLAKARELLAIDLPVTFSVLPNVPHAAEVAELAHRGGRQVLIHIPMEPQGYPAADPGQEALFVGMTAEEIRLRMAGYRQRIPQAVGGNNHMGSRFTEDREGMAVVIGEMREAGLFFVDSLTTGRSVAAEEARQAGVPSLSRDIFLDNDPSVRQISQQIRKLAALARQQGQAVGICHPYPETLAALRREVAYLQRQGIEVVPVSQLLPP